MDIPSIIRRLRGTDEEILLLATHEAGGETDPQTVMGTDHNDPSPSRAADALRSLGLAEGEPSLAGEVHLTRLGRRVAEMVMQSRTRGEDRWDAVTKAVAARVIEGPTHDWRVPMVDDVQVTEDELTVAIDRLKRWGCLQSIERWQGGIARALPLDRIHEVPGVVGPLKDHFEGAGISSVDNSVHNSSHIVNSTVGGVQTGGSGNTQHVAQTISMEDRVHVLASVGKILAEIPVNEDTQALREQVTSILDEAGRNETTSSQIKDRVVLAIATAGATKGVDLALNGLAQLLGTLVP